MNASQLFSHISPSLANELFDFLQAQDKASYKSAIGTLAKQRNLRPQFIERKPKLERHVWMRDAVARPINENIAANLLQIWLINARSPMLVDFLDALSIPHDGKGGIDSLPPSPAKEALEKAVNGLLEKYPKEEVLVYLYMFQAMDIAGWPLLQEILDSEEIQKIFSTR